MLFHPNLKVRVPWSCRCRLLVNRSFVTCGLSLKAVLIVTSLQGTRSHSGILLSNDSAWLGKADGVSLGLLHIYCVSKFCCCDLCSHLSRGELFVEQKYLVLMKSKISLLFCGLGPWCIPRTRFSIKFVMVFLCVCVSVFSYFWLSDRLRPVSFVFTCGCLLVSVRP